MVAGRCIRGAATRPPHTPPESENDSGAVAASRASMVKSKKVEELSTLL